ncbi:MAG: NAD(P)H-dependent oxidoreductase [Bacteroidota bacterium]|nr:NAD(P)H-dependent oxidoreductase [Bacteroidota bacterium]
MKLTIFNGSPRNKQSNSKLLIDNFLIGYDKISEKKADVHFIASSKNKEEQLKAFQNAEIVIIIFPLYTDSMPGIVKEFFEQIYSLEPSTFKKIGFIVQSGFPEAIHSTYVEKYLKKFTSRLKCEYLGTIIKGGVEGIKIMPPIMTKKLFNNFQLLGEYFAKNEAFSEKIKTKLAKPLTMSTFRRVSFSFFSFLGFTNFYWNSNLKKNKAYKKRFDKPLLNKE